VRILFADQFSEFGGAQIALRNLLDAVVQRGWQAKVMAPGNGPLHLACASRGIPSSSLPFARYASGHKTVRDIFRYGTDTVCAGLAIRDAAREFGADVIYVNGPRVLPAAVFARGSERVPIIFHAHSYPGRGYARRILGWCIRQENVRVLAISRFVARPFAGTARVVYNGSRDHGFLLRPRSKPACIGILGRISQEKGHLDFVRAAAAMADSRPGLRFLVFGDTLFGDCGYEREVRAAAKGAPVEFRGWTEDVAAALHEIDMLAVPSGPGEGATLVIMEAFSAGTPVVAFPSGGIPELVRHGDTGLLTSARGHEPLAKALGELLDNPGLMERLCRRSRREWETRFRLEQAQSGICDFIEESLECSPGASLIRSSAQTAEYGGGAEREAL
jgi:glycosyltransferase involved in cell wall biosynthesis